MIHQDVIEWKISQLVKGKSDNSEMSAQMSDYVAAHVDLQDELVFTETFYMQNPTPIEPPSAKLRQNFYQMLDKHSNKTPWAEAFKRWLAPNPFPQFVALAAVFYLGFSLNSEELQSEQALSSPTGRLVSLEKEVSSLTSLIAIAMLQKSSASERLTGVAYSKRTGLDDPKLNQTMIELLQTDSSTAVRLAIVNALEQSNGVAQNETVLSEIALSDSNPLVQMELLKLLLTQGSSAATSKLLSELDRIELNQDVKQFIQKIKNSYQA